MPPDWNNPDPEQEYVLSIAQNQSDRDFIRIEGWLGGDDRVVGFGRDEGQWYSNGEARGDWYAIRITVQYQHRDALQKDLQGRIDGELSGRLLKVVCM